VKVSITEAKNRLTQLLHKVEEGERIEICRHGVAIACLTRVQPKSGKRKYGTLKHKIKILDPDWAKAQNDVEAWMRGDV
jgi:prevent-host-death family protein